MKEIREALDLCEKAISGFNVTDAEVIWSIKDARDELKQLKENLRGIEWKLLSYEQEYYCPACDSPKEEGHKPNCWLDKMIGGE